MSNELKKNGNYVVFALEKEIYAFPIEFVREINHYATPTPIANSEPYFLGIIRLRNEAVPIFDLRIFFKQDKIEYSEYTVLIILKIVDNTVGIIVDKVLDITNISLEQIYPFPSFPTAIQNQYILGISDYHNETLILLDIEYFLSKNFNKTNINKEKNEAKS